MPRVLLAVRVGFEPTRGLRPSGISSAASSAGPPHPPRPRKRSPMTFPKDQAGDAPSTTGPGRIRIFLPTESGGELTVEVAGPGDVFGELALLDGRPRSASAETLEDSALHTVNRSEFTQYVAA